MTGADAILQAPPAQTRHQIVERVRALAPGFAARAEAAEEARRLPEASVREMLDAGIARILVPPRFGGYGLGFEAWLEVVREIARSDASHGWCASLMIHHPHLIGQFPEEAQQAVWADGPDVSISASILPAAHIARDGDGYRVSGQNSAFSSGIWHSDWAMVGGYLPGQSGPEWTLFLIPRADYSIRDTWFTSGMRATGSCTIVTDNVFVPASHIIKLTDLRDGTGPGGKVNDSPIYRTPFFFFAPLTFTTPMLGAAQGAYQHFRDSTRTRRSTGGVSVAEKTSIQVGMARAAADLDAAELLMQRAADISHAGDNPPSRRLLPRSVRDYSRAAELILSAIDTLVSLSGAAGFASSNPIQRAWRDIHFASMHGSLNAESNFAHFGRSELGLPRDTSQPFF